jgi:hypothetical protein
MPQFYFDFFRQQQCLPDNIGSDLANLDAAKAEAVAAAAGWMKDNASITGTELTVTILDHERNPLYAVTAAVIVRAIGQSAADIQPKGIEKGLFFGGVRTEFSSVAS